MKTAEWICTACGTTNRKLVSEGSDEVFDRCIHCGRKHAVRAGERPVRWDAALVK